ncbi:ATP-grasp domain-containing protein [Streptomyces sp. NPDC002004]
MSEPVCLLGAGGTRAAGSEFHLKQIADSHPVVLLDALAPTWARPYLIHHIAADPADPAAALAAVRSYRTRHELRGALTYVPEHLGTTARIAGLLRTPTTSVESLVPCSDLAELRRQLTRHKVPQPRWAEVLDAESAAAHAALLGCPVLIKPSRRTGAIAVQAHDRNEARTAYELVTRPVAGLAADRHESAVVEEYLDGEEVSAETVVLDDEDVRITAVTRTVLGPPPTQQALRHSVFAHDPLLHNPVLRRVVTRAVRALGITLGVVSVRMRLTSRGPCVTDVSAHLAADLVPLLVKRATGIDLPRIAADLSTGRTPHLAPTQQRAAAIQFLYANATGHISRLALDPRGACQPLLDGVVLTQQVGNHVTSGPHATPVDRIAHCVVLGPDASSCHSALDRMAQHIDVDIAPSSSAMAGWAAAGAPPWSATTGAVTPAVMVPADA